MKEPGLRSTGWCWICRCITIRSNPILRGWHFVVFWWMDPGSYPQGRLAPPHMGFIACCCHARIGPMAGKISLPSAENAAGPCGGRPALFFRLRAVLSPLWAYARASYLMSLLVLPARNWVTSAVLFSSLYRPGTAAYRAAQETRSCFQVISLGAWAWDSAPGPKPTQGMP